MSSLTLNNLANAAARESLSRSEPLSLVSICADEDTWRSLRFIAESAPLLQLRSRREQYCAQDETVLEYIGDPVPDICLIDFDRDRRSAAMVAERIRATAPETAIFAVSSQSQPELIIEAMRSGCSEYLVKPLDREQLAKAAVRIRGRKQEKKEYYKAQVLGFMGAKGGCGVTTLATQMGALLASSFGRKTLIIDFHPDCGDAALYLGLTKTHYHFFELLESTDRMDGELLQSFLVHHSSGLDLIPAPDGAEMSRGILPGTSTQTVDFLRQRYEFILIDLPPGLSDENLEIIRACDQLYLIAVAEVAAVRNLVRQTEYFRHKDVALDRLRVVLNRHQKRSLVSDAQIEKVINQRIYWRVPNQYAQVVKTIHEGDPVAQLANSEVTRNLKEWASTIGRKAAAEDKKKENGGILGFWNR
jgi:pilus assembly protein CpaE